VSSTYLHLTTEVKVKTSIVWLPSGVGSGGSKHSQMGHLTHSGRTTAFGAIPLQLSAAKALGGRAQ